MITFSLICGLLLVVLARDFVCWWRLRHIPGPILNSLTVTALMAKIFRRQSAWYFTELSDQYGPLVRIAPGLVMTTNADALRHINGVRSRFSRGPFFTAFRFVPGRDNIFSMQSDVNHKFHRSRLAPAYLGRGNEGYDVHIDRQLHRLFSLIDRKYVSTPSESKTLDFNAVSQFFPLDVIGDVAFGKPFGFLDEGQDLYRFVAVNEKFFIYAVTLACVPWALGFLHRWPLRLLLPTDADVSGFGKMINVTKVFINDRHLPGAQPGKDMLQALMDAGLTRDELVQESIVQIVAGTDTIGSTLRTIIACLLSRPEVYHRLVVHIMAHDTEGKISSPATDAECQSMPYLQAVIKEAMRLYPPLTALAFKAVPPEGETIDGYYLPAGTQLGQNIYGILRDVNFWGPDANIFLPERWCDRNGDRGMEMESELDLTFGWGKYKCLGRRLALAEVNKFLVEFIRRYDFAATTVHNPYHLSAAFGWPSDHFDLRITRRFKVE